MGFFKKKSNSVNVNILSASGMVDHIKSNLNKPTDTNALKVMKKVVQPDADQDHLTPDGELPWGWLNNNREFIEKIENEQKHFLNAWLNSMDKSSKEQYAALKSLVIYLNDTKELCHSKNECFAYWFDGCVADSNYIAKRTQELSTLEKKLHE